MEDMTSCPDIKECNHCGEDHLYFSLELPEYNFQTEILNAAYSNKTNFRNAKLVLWLNNKSYATTIKTTLPSTTRNIHYSTQPSPPNNTKTQQSVMPTAPITAAGTGTSSSVPIASLPGISSETTASNKNSSHKIFSIYWNCYIQ